MLVQFLIGAVACIGSITIMVGTVSLPMLAHRAEVFVRAAIYELVTAVIFEVLRQAITLLPPPQTV